MRSACLILFGIMLLGLPAAASAQDPVSPRGQLDRERAGRARIAPDARFPDDTLGFPDDTLGLPADTTPRVDIEARRQALETEGFPARDDIFRQLKDLPGFMVFEYRGEQVQLEVEEQRIGLLGDAQVNRGNDVLTADTIRYRGNVKFMSAIGNIQLVGAD
jgi:hypothetical protein